ncbi:MAG: 7-cyano-7-deazaguanine synthase QueC [Helicobacteraceae bacterium]|jgi:7-cyano-7-deazaguanine synthase|nr:7-cyano-7-deazaguanine synthase QueC [Helicobacteraceae bacterium]
MNSSVCIVSGGMDSATALALTIAGGRTPIALHFSYRQRTERRERRSFDALCDFYAIKSRYTFDLGFFADIGASALTDLSIDVPQYADRAAAQGIPVTYVPFRNGIFLSIAAAVAEKESADEIVIGAVEEDSSGYPDCRERFLREMQTAIGLGVRDTTKIAINAPLIHLSKEQIVREALRLNVPLRLTWSCYQDGEKACGVCESCRLRLKGFTLANAVDPIAYFSN